MPLTSVFFIICVTQHNCGIWPVDRTQDPVSRFKEILQHWYNTWVKEGKKPLSAEELDKMFEESLKNQEEPHSSDMGPVVQQVQIGKNGNRMTYEGM